MVCRFLAPLVALTLALQAAWTESAPTVDLLDSRARWVEVETDPAVFTLEQNALSAQRRTYQSATVVTRDDVENFDLSFDFLVHRWCELILAIHTPRNYAWEAGLEVVLSDHAGDAPNTYSAGALLDHVAPPTMAMRKNDLWNHCEIHMDWPAFRLELNGKTVQDLDLSASPDLRDKLRRGALGFRDLLGWGFEVKNMEFTPLPDSEHAITLFNGENLDGWREVRKGEATWTVKDGILMSAGGNGYLQHGKLVQDFDFRLLYRTTSTANGGVFIRWMPDDSDRGNEIQILDVGQSVMPSGSIYNIARATDAPIHEGDWNCLQIRVEGLHAITHLNGVKAAETDALWVDRPGLITLQMHKENSTIEFKDLALVPLD